MVWKTAWKYLPINYNTIIGTVENITQKTQIRINLDGTKIKVKLSNRYGTEPLTVEKMILRKQIGSETGEIASIEVTYKGKQRIVIEQFQEFYSDELPFLVEAGDLIELLLYVKEKTEISSACATWSTKSWNTVYGVEGDYTKTEKFEEKQSSEVYPYVEEDENKANIVIGVCELCVFTKEQVKTVALFGDSITHMSYYYDALLERLEKEHKGMVTLINCGIGGNRMLRNATYVEQFKGNGKCFGKAGISRFKEDVCSNKDVEAVVILEGVNDIMHPYVFNHAQERVSTAELIKGLEQLVKVAHEHEIKAYLGTIMPFRGKETEWILEGEVIRVEVNEWIRTQKIADGMVDFSKATESKKNPKYMEEKYHIGDGLHPGSEGGKRMAEEVPLAWFV